MKNIITLTLAFISFAAASQSRIKEFSMGYVFSLPRSPMNETIRNASGLAIDCYFTPRGKRYMLGAEISVNGYGHDKTRQTYSFDDGSTAQMDIAVNNNFYNLLLGGRYYLGHGRVQPFVTGKFGYSFYSTDLNIYDPDDFDHCEPVDTEVLKKDGSLIFSAGAGLQWDLRPKTKPGVLFLTLAANYLSGGKVSYMNVDAPMQSQAAHQSDVYTKFLNTQTQVVHEHHVGNVYSSLIEMMDFRLGISLRMTYPANGE